MKQIDVALLPTLDALLTQANVTRAAARLGISQPALSAKLRRLRDLTGDALLVASGKGRGMVLTPYGLSLRDKVRVALSSVDRALGDQVAFDPMTSEATFRIIANDNAASVVVATIVAKVAGMHARGIRLALLRPDERTIADRLENGDADLAISAEHRPRGGEQLHQQAILDDRYVTAQRRGHPRGSAPFDLDSFCSVDHLVVSDRGDFDGSVDVILRDLGRERHVTLSLNSYLLAPTIVAQSDLVVTLPRRLFDTKRGDLDLFELPFALPQITLSAFWHDRTDGDRGNSWLRNAVFDATSVHADLLSQ